MKKSLLSELKRFRNSEKVSMHIPGHKSGRGLGAYFVRNAFDIDVTEVSGTDDLQNPSGILCDAQNRCAKVFAARKSYFLTEGSSLGLRAAVMAVCGRGGKLLVDRTCHKSVISGIILGGIEPIFINPDFDDEKGLYVGISAAAVKRMLEQNPDICGAVITSPTYYGICSDIAEIASVLHGRGKALIVDEAHGAHFAFGRDLPKSAISLGADISVQSAHKTLPALGQCSVLHISKNSTVDVSRLEKTLALMRTTSPSYLLMTSLDESVRIMHKSGGYKLSRLIREIDRLKAEVCEKTVISFIDSGNLFKEQDKTRIVADFSAAEISGKYAESLLITEFGIYPEMSDNRYVVFVPSVATTMREIRQLCVALCSIGGRRFKDCKAEQNAPLPDIELEYIPFKAADMPCETADVDNCIGRVSAQIISVCPPGAAILVPGQRISAEIADYIKQNNVAETIEVIKTNA